MSTDIVDEIRDALANGEEDFARMLLRDHELSLSGRQRELVKALFKQYKDTVTSA